MTTAPTAKLKKPPVEDASPRPWVRRHDVLYDAEGNPVLKLGRLTDSAQADLVLVHQCVNALGGAPDPGQWVADVLTFLMQIEAHHSCKALTSAQKREAGRLVDALD